MLSRLKRRLEDSMSFISLTFAVFFFVFVCLYHLAGRFAKNGALAQKILFLAANLVFYAAADLRFVPFLAYAILLSYFAAIILDSETQKNRKALFALFMAADFVPLLFCKYNPSHFIFPLGISFFTFQSAGYIADCQTKKVRAERNFLNVALFISFFPTISNGPIQRAQKLIPQFSEVHHFEYESAADGVKLFAWGMFKKLCVADRIAAYVNYVYGGAESQYGSALVLATVLYFFQIYCDFSGYSDMAIGAAKYCGFDVGRNFNYPYIAQSVGDFWRRWHISLSSWFRDYVYIPLGGSRVALPRIYLNLLITFLASGIWHGAGWTFVIWGLLHGIFICVGRATKSFWEKSRLPPLVRVLITFSLVALSLVFFRAKDLGQAFLVMRKTVEFPKAAAALFASGVGIKDFAKEIFALNNGAYGYFSGMAATMILLCAMCACEITVRKSGGVEWMKKRPAALRWLLYFVLCAVIFYCSKTDMSGNFIYNNF